MLWLPVLASSSLRISGWTEEVFQLSAESLFPVSKSPFSIKLAADDNFLSNASPSARLTPSSLSWSSTSSSERVPFALSSSN